MSNKTYYDILQVPSTASFQQIRKSYLKLSLKYHPDKNPDNPEEAKTKFIEIGQAYETLSDTNKRRIYDSELSRATRQSSSDGGGNNNNRRPRQYYSSSSTTNNNNGPSSFSSSTPHYNTEYYDYGFYSTNEHNNSNFNTEYNTTNNNGTSTRNPSREQTYTNYRDKFDATVAGMSEEELSAAIGTVAAIAGIVGHVLGNYVANRNTRNRSGGGGGVMMNNSSAGSNTTSLGAICCSYVASEIAASSVRALHQECIQRIEYKQKRQQAIDRGESLPPEYPKNHNMLGGFVRNTIHKIMDITHCNNAS